MRSSQTSCQSYCKTLRECHRTPSCNGVSGTAILEPSWSRLGLCRARFEPSWSRLGPSWSHSEAILGPLWAVLGQIRAILEPSWAHLGPILEPPWAILGPSWGHLFARCCL